MSMFPEQVPGSIFPMGNGDVPSPTVPDETASRQVGDVPGLPGSPVPGELPNDGTLPGRSLGSEEVPDITAPDTRGRTSEYIGVPAVAAMSDVPPASGGDGGGDVADASQEAEPAARIEHVAERREPLDDTEGRERAAAIETRLEQTAELDPELLEHPEIRELVEMGAEVGQRVTESYGTPDHPKVASGTHEKDVFMSYHNGGEDGHTSMGERGAGVPRNVLLIAKAVNEAAGYEVYPPEERGKVVLAAWRHDEKQLCGRTLLPEGQGEGRGDERLTAEAAREELLQAGREDVADDVGDLIVASAWNPEVSKQNIRYDRLVADPTNPAVRQQALNQELLGAADLLSPSTQRGPLGTVEYAVERMFLHKPMPEGMEGQPAQRRLAELGIQVADIADMEQMMEVISSDPVLRSTFTDILASDPVFYADHLKYSDTLIREVCGKGIDDLFPQRVNNSATLALHVLRLRSGETPAQVWQRARREAGYVH